MTLPLMDNARNARPARDDDGSFHHGLLQLGRALAAAGYRYQAISAASHQRVVQRLRQSKAPAASPPATLGDVFGLSRPFSAEHLPARVWNAMNEAGIVRRDGALWRSTVRVASCAHQLYFHSAWPTIDDDAVFFGPDTYRMLGALDAALAEGPVRRALDIGCGAGAGAVAIARHWPLAEVLAADGNPTALTLATVNADLAGTPRVRVVPLDRDVADSSALAQVEGDFDLILAQPPYLLDPCRRMLRDGGGQLGEARTIGVVSDAIRRLAPGGRLLLYTGVAMVAGTDPVLARLAPMLDGAGLAWTYRELEGDIHGDELGEAGYEQVDRIAAVWLEARR